MTHPAQPRILLVDDNSAILVRAAAMLSHDYAVVGTVNDGPAALAAVAELRPDVVVLDISMPGMSGFEVARRLRKSGAAPPIVFLTVHDDEEFVLAAEAAGGAGFVVKHRLTTDLPHAVMEVLAGRRYVSDLH
jgi:DNA-binding NarL/FixJ family response regulator